MAETRGVAKLVAGDPERRQSPTWPRAVLSPLPDRGDGDVVALDVRRRVDAAARRHRGDRHDSGEGGRVAGAVLGVRCRLPVARTGDDERALARGVRDGVGQTGVGPVDTERDVDDLGPEVGAGPDAVSEPLHRRRHRSQPLVGRRTGARHTEDLDGQQRRAVGQPHLTGPLDGAAADQAGDGGAVAGQVVAAGRVGGPAVDGRQERATGGHGGLLREVRVAHVDARVDDGDGDPTARRELPDRAHTHLGEGGRALGDVDGGGAGVGAGLVGSGGRGGGSDDQPDETGPPRQEGQGGDEAHRPGPARPARGHDEPSIVGAPTADSLSAGPAGICDTHAGGTKRGVTPL